MKTLLVDIDGVVLLGGRGGWAVNLEADLGLSMKALNTQFFKVHWQQIVTGKMSIEVGLAAVLETLAPHVSVEDFLNYWFEKDIKTDSQLLADMDALRKTGWSIYFATNQDHRRAAHLMSGLRLENHVDGIFYAAQIGHKKPDPSFYAHIENQLGLPGRDLYFIDDTSSNIIAARKRNWHAHLWNGEERLSTLLASMIRQR